MQLHLALTIDVDEDAWALDYGQTPEEVAKDAPEHVSALVAHVVEERAKLMGTFTLAHRSVAVIGEVTQPGQVVPAPRLSPRLGVADSRFYATADPRVLVARWGNENWRTVIEYDEVWDHTGTWHPTMAAAIASAPAVARRCF